VIAEAWERVRRFKDSVGDGRPADERSVVDTYDEGEAWVRAVLDHAGLGSEAEVDALMTIVNENGVVSLHNILSMDRTQLRSAAVIGGLATADDPPAAVDLLMYARLMHGSGFANGLALGLLINRP
jgi:hypothetical protein